MIQQYNDKREVAVGFVNLAGVEYPYVKLPAKAFELYERTEGINERTYTGSSSNSLVNKVHTRQCEKIVGVYRQHLWYRG
jgi:hypothetical protein